MLQLKDLIKYCNPNLILLLETKVQSEKTEEVNKPFNFSNFIEILTEGLSAGIWLLSRSSTISHFKLSVPIINLYMVEFMIILRISLVSYFRLWLYLTTFTKTSLESN